MRARTTCLIVTLSIFSVLFVLPPNAYASRPPFLDGSNQERYGPALSNTITITTSHENDIIIVAATEPESRALGISPISTISDTAGLSWAKRLRLPGPAQNANLLNDEEVWYAVSAKRLGSDSITVEFSPPCCGTESRAGGYNFTLQGDLEVFAISGVDTANPFDPNPTVPATETLNCLPSPPFGPGCVSQPSVAISTSNRKDLVYGIVAVGLFGCGYLNATNVDSGFSLIQHGACSAIEYRTVTSRASSNLKVGFTLTSNQTNEWSMIGDAVQGPPIHSCMTDGFSGLAIVDILNLRICPSVIA